MTNFRSLVPGGHFSDAPFDLSRKRSERTNNPLALNISQWQRGYPGFAGVTAPDASKNANVSAIYETPEHGFAAGWELQRKYQAGEIGGTKARTIRERITKYGGTNQDYSEYLKNVAQWTGMAPDTLIDVNNDQQMLALFKAMMRWESGLNPPPWNDAQILLGMKMGREYAATGKMTAAPGASAPTAPTMPQTSLPPVKSSPGGIFAVLSALFSMLFTRKLPAPAGGLTYTRDLKDGDRDAVKTGGPIWKLQERLRAIGFADLLVDGDYGEVTTKAIREVQSRHNLDPDGETGRLTIDVLNRPDAILPKPPLLPPSTAKYGDPPPWYPIAEKDIGFRETGNNQGIERLIAGAKTGSLGDPYCAIGLNYCAETSGVHGTRSPAAQSFKNDKINCYKLDAPALGCIGVMWRGSPNSGLGHCFFYDGETRDGKRIRGIGYNENNKCARSFHEAGRMLGYYWFKAGPPPKLGRIIVNDDGSNIASREV